ncbi:MAG: branched-chain amino acid ABC transporter permease, partial [Vicinamibacteria bacterium]
PVDGLMTALIGGVLLLQRARVSRVEQELASSWRAAREIRPTPAVLAERPEIRRRRRLGLTVGLVLLAGYPFVMSPLQTARTTTAVIYGLVGLSLLLLSGWAGQLSLGQFALAGAGAYVASLAAVNLSMPMPVALVAGGLAGAAGAVLIGVPALRMRGLHLAITTLAVSLAASSILFSPSELGRFIPETLDRPSWLGFDLDDGRSFYFVSLLLTGAAALGVRWLRASRFGRTLIAARDNEPAAQAFGIAVVRLRVQAFAISGFLAGVAGSLLAYQQFGLKAASFTPDTSVVVFLMALIGGLGALSGPLIGAAYLGMLSIAAVSLLVLFLGTGGGLVFLLMTAPGGLAQIVFGVRDAALRRFARRRGIHVPSLIGRDGGAGERGKLAPKTEGEGRAVFVPRRYRLDGQWAVPEPEPAEAPNG